jgi:hypothetical protein
VPLLRERGIDLSASQVHRLVSGAPKRMPLPGYQPITLVPMRCGLRVNDALRLRRDCIVRDADSAPICATTSTR